LPLIFTGAAAAALRLSPRRSIAAPFMLPRLEAALLRYGDERDMLLPREATCLMMRRWR